LNTEHKLCENYGNAIYIREFKRETEDSELLILCDYLKGLVNCSNVRDIEKCNWRSQTLNRLNI